ncbi:uncharacterized protein LOC101220151 [Cucumis sativus]|uniref:Uncharacterized protein n=1 Tax=Cucumis sativus TaxID=3659 RepID=A0A0A0KGT1_CUCSA|nr:uncharacterized protein LOC101220151 [Cucumis sativus]KGN46966.1 hypothetical protein Csa_020778 [Cucumis sativus]
MEMEVESDDLLFAELTRRISLLIMDDDELPIAHTNFTRTVHQLRPRELPLMMDYENGFVRESKGTGVFIPARLPPRKRKQKNVTAGYRIKSENKRLNGQPSPTYYCKPK